MQSYYTIQNESCAEIEAKKSKFIARSFIVTEESIAAEKLALMRKTYSDASHICYAYILNNGITKNSDDKEPAKTAGYPILEAIKNKNLYNVMVTVTRYFGGVKLGTGGLARAYGGAAAAVLTVSGALNYVYSVQYNVKTEYTYASAVEKAALSSGEITNKVYGEGADITAVCPAESFEEAAGAINGVTSGKAVIAVKNNLYYPYKDI